VFVVSSLLIFFMVLAIGGEIILRSKGFRPWQLSDVAIKVNPGGKLYNRHPTLGYVHIPGKFTVTLPDGYSFQMTHLPNTLRITHPLSTYKEPGQKGEIWIFGCSFTHGWSLNDQETFPWLLQERFPEYEVVNFGVGGYGTMHSLIQLREALKQGRVPKFVVLAYAGFHIERNVFLRTEKKSVAPYNKLGPVLHPYARIDAHGKLSYGLAGIEYYEFPLMRYSALVHSFEEIFNRFEANYYHIREVTEALILEMSSTAKNNKIPFVLAGITQSQGTSKMLEFAQHNGVQVLDIAVNLNVPENTNLPHDCHPSADANRKYADKLEAFLRAAGVSN
jgi:hypothetical protein